MPQIVRVAHATAHILLFLRALALGYSFEQLPVRFDPRMEGESFIQRPFLFSMKVLVDLPKAIWLYGVLPRIGGRP